MAPPAAELDDPATTALLGPVYAPTLGGLIAWRAGAQGMIIMGLASLLLVIRHTREEEEAGRRELLGSGVVGRLAPLTAALTVVLGTNLLIAVLLTALLTSALAGYVLRRLLVKRGDLDGLAARAATGDLMAAKALADLLADRGDVASLTARADRSDRFAAERLAKLYAERAERAERAARADAGDSAAAKMLATQLAARRDRGTLRARAESGNRHARTALHRLDATEVVSSGYDSGGYSDDYSDDYSDGGGDYGGGSDWSRSIRGAAVQPARRALLA